MDEWELLRRFARDGSQEAFAALVRRHLDFVYSCARRQVRSPELAEEVAQSVFVELARQAGTLRTDTPLTAWLYVVTRRAALNVLRGELRRHAREHTAYELAAMSAQPSLWEKLAPLLDEALETLNPHDRCALLLRYFDNRSLRDVGAAMGTSEEAAQKRLARALDRLRVYFTKHGVPITAAALATHLATNAVEAAPLALGGAISSATGALTASAASTSTLALEATQAVAMTTLQKSLLVGALVVIGASVYEVRALAGQRDQLAVLEREAAELAAREVATREMQDASRSRLALARAESASAAAVATTAAPTAGDPAIAEIVARVEALKKHFATNPALRIPELALLPEADWFQVARFGPVSTEVGLRPALSRLRMMAKIQLARPFTQALTAYAKANAGRLPPSANDLQPHFASLSVDPATLGAILARYEIKAQGIITDVPPQAVILQEREEALVDRDFDYRTRISRNAGSGSNREPYAIGYATTNIPGPLTPAQAGFLR